MFSHVALLEQTLRPKLDFTPDGMFTDPVHLDLGMWYVG